MIGMLPSLAPRPTATNIRALEIDLVEKLTMIPSEQSVNFGLSWKVEAEVVYALKTKISWEIGKIQGHMSCSPVI